MFASVAGAFGKPHVKGFSSPPSLSLSLPPSSILQPAASAQSVDEEAQTTLVMAAAAASAVLVIIAVALVLYIRKQMIKLNIGPRAKNDIPHMRRDHVTGKEFYENPLFSPDNILSAKSSESVTSYDTSVDSHPATAWSAPSGLCEGPFPPPDSPPHHAGYFTISTRCCTPQSTKSRQDSRHSPTRIALSGQEGQEQRPRAAAAAALASGPLGALLTSMNSTSRSAVIDLG